MQSLSNYHGTFHRTRTKKNCMETQKTQYSQINLKKKKWVQSLWHFVSAVAQVKAVIWSLGPSGGLKIWLCHSCGIGQSCGLDSNSGPETSICHECGYKRKKKRKEKQRWRNQAGWLHTIPQSTSHQNNTTTNNRTVWYWRTNRNIG